MPPPNHASSPTLNKSLGLFTSIMLVAGIMIGSGVFKKIIPMAQTGLSPLWILGAWAMAGIITMLGAFTMSGYAGVTDKSGGVYEYLRLSFGNFYSFLFGWADFTIIGGASIAAIAYIFAQTVHSLVPLPDFFPQLSHYSLFNYIYPFRDSGIKLIAIIAIGFLTWVNMRGVKQGGIVNNLLTSAKITGIILIIALGLSYTGATHNTLNNWSVPYSGSTGFLSAFFVAMLSAFWAYDGWSNITYVTGEIKNHEKNLPKAIVGGVIIAMSLYLLINLAYMYVLPVEALAAVGKNTIGAVVVTEQLIGNSGKWLISILIMISVFGTLSATTLVHARVHYRMAEEKCFFPKAATIHPRYRTPHVALLYTFIWSSILVISGTFDQLTDMVIFAGFVFYATAAAGLIRLKKKGVIKHKPLGYPWAPLIFILFSIGLIYNTISSRPYESLIGIVLILSGVPFYFYFKKPNKKNDTTL